MGRIGTCCCNCCTDVTASLPTITITGYTGGAWTSVTDCCKKKTFTPNASSNSVACGTLITKTWTQECLRKAWAFNMPPGLEAGSAACPPDPDVYCFSDPLLVHVGTSTLDLFEQNNLGFKVTYASPTIEVVFGRGEFTCSGVKVCKWFIKTRVIYSVVAAYVTSISWTKTRTTESVHPCFTANTNSDGTTNANYPPPSDPCEGLWDTCSQTTNFVIFERIKIWDELPEDGEFTFGNSDTGSDCEEKPSCASGTFDLTEACFSVQSDLDCDPCWQPFTIVNNPTTVTVGPLEIRTATGIVGDAEFCTQEFTNCNSNFTTCPAVSQTLPCESVVFYGDASGFCTCGAYQPQNGCPTSVLQQDGIYVECGFFGVEPSPDFTATYGVCVRSLGNCVSTCCYIIGSEDCSSCIPKYTPLFWTGALAGSQEVSVSTTCSSYNDPPVPPVCITYTPVVLTVDFV